MPRGGLRIWTEPIGIWINPAMLRWLKKQAKKEKKPLQSIVRLLIINAMERELEVLSTTKGGE